MFDRILKLIKKIIFSCFLIYGYNLIVQPLGIMIPINFITIVSNVILGLPAFLSIIFIMVFIY